MNFWITRDIDCFHIRKVLIELADDEGNLINSSRMFAWPLRSLHRRLERRKARMLRCATTMQLASGKAVIKKGK